jgi:hypothetical protein
LMWKFNLKFNPKFDPKSSLSHNPYPYQLELHKLICGIYPFNIAVIVGSELIIRINSVIAVGPKSNKQT